MQAPKWNCAFLQHRLRDRQGYVPGGSRKFTGRHKRHGAHERRHARKFEFSRWTTIHSCGKASPV